MEIYELLKKTLLESGDAGVAMILMFAGARWFFIKYEERVEKHLKSVQQSNENYQRVINDFEKALGENTQALNRLTASLVHKN